MSTPERAKGAGVSAPGASAGASTEGEADGEAKSGAGGEGGGGAEGDLRIELGEGRNRQIRKMAEALGLEVLVHHGNGGFRWRIRD